MKFVALMLSIVGMVVGTVSNPVFAALANINGYVCSTTYTRQNNVSFGQGWVRVQVTANTGCSGTNLGSFYYLGNGATISGFQFSEAERLQLFHEATKAAKDGTHINLFVETAGGGIFHTSYFAN